MKKMLSNKRTIALFTLPAFLVFTVFFAIPIVATVILSFTDWNGVSLSTIKFINVENFINMFTNDAVFWIGLKNSIILLVLTVCIQVPVALLLALILDRCTKFLNFFKTAYFIPVLFSAAAAGLLWGRVFDVRNGLINKIFAFFDIAPQQWLSNENTVIFALAFPLIWKEIGYYMVILYAAIKSIPKDYFEAALLDGCNTIQSTWYVTIPMCRNSLNTVIVLTAVAALRVYPLIYTMTGGGPFNSSSTLAIQMYTESFLKMNFGYGSALAVVLVIECLITSKIINKLFPQQELQF